jgi:DHA1 family multidrug resistance protein-like MFS transporter
MGLHGGAVDLWAGMIFSANFIMMAIVSPMWGALSDKYGRRPMMLRSAFGMAVVTCLMGLAQNQYHLLGLRLLQGLTAGFVPASAAYMVSIAPRERVGYALGLLTTGSVTGTILGPMVGGLLAKGMGYRPIFFLTSISCLLGGLVVLLTIKENFTPAPKAADGKDSLLGMMKQYPQVVGVAGLLFLTNTSIMTAEPILSRFLESLHAPAGWVEFLSGFVFSTTGMANLVIAPRAGTLTDRVGSKRILSVAVAGAAVVYLFQGMVGAVWQMAVLRFCLGLFTGAIQPAASSLLARSAPREVQGRLYGLTNSAVFLGNTIGPLLGGSLAAGWGLRAPFPVTAGLMALGFLWARWGLKEGAVLKESLA